MMHSKLRTIGECIHINHLYIDQAMNTTTYEIFNSYGKMFNRNEWDGMKLIEKALCKLNLGGEELPCQQVRDPYSSYFDATDTGINIPHSLHKRLMEDYMFRNMYTRYKAELCPGGFF